MPRYAFLSLLSLRDRLAMIVFAALLILVALVVAAPASEETVDLGPSAVLLIRWFGPAATVVIVLLGGWVLVKLASFLGLKVSALHRAVIEAGLEKAVGYAVSRLEDRTAGGIPIAVKSDAIRIVVDYALQQFPRALKHFGKTPEQLEAMAEARLQDVLVDPDTERKMRASFARIPSGSELGGIAASAI